MAEAFVPELRHGAKYEAKKIGGTKQKTDLELVMATDTKRFSLKKKEGTTVGSYDWVNTGRPITANPRFADLRALCKSFQRGKPPTKAEYAAAKKTVTAALVENRRLFTGEDILDILATHVVEPYEIIDLILINDVVNRKLYGCAPNALPFFKYMGGSHREVFVRENGKKSASVIFKDASGNELDFGIRFRLETNNGITAMFGGRPGKNNSSSPVIKIQQDNVKGLLDSIDGDDLTVWSY